MKQFEIAQGGVIGRDHRLTPKNYQDGRCLYQNEDFTVAIVTDGCGSSLHSEIGAQLGAKLMCRYLANECQRVGSSDQIQWSRVLQNLRSTMHGLARELGESLSQVVMEYLLFSIVGVVISKSEAIFFSIGDGVIVINDEVNVVEPMEGNQPQYWAYQLVESNLNDAGVSEEMTFFRSMPTEELNSFLIGCDGISDLISVQDKTLPGLNETIGTLSQFWEEDHFFTNSDMVSRRLRLVARDWPKKSPQPGLLPDDTTLIVGRRLITQ